MTETRTARQIAILGLVFGSCLLNAEHLNGARAGEVSGALTPAAEADSLLTAIRFLDSDIATRSVIQDTDEAPGLVQVFRREDLLARGIKTVAEALAGMAGIDVPIDNLGIRQPVIRGFGGILSGATGKLKYLLNGVSVNSTQSASGSVFLEIPIEQIERIDIIRGPGSAVYGENAFLGVVDVTTRGEGRGAYLGVGSNNTVAAGGLWSYTSPTGTNVSLNVAGRKTDGADVDIGQDPLYSLGQAAISNAPGSTNEYREETTMVLRLNRGGFSLLAQYLAGGLGDHFGALFLPPPEKRDVISNRWWTVEASQILSPTPESELRMKAGWKSFRNRFDDVQLSPPGFFGIYPQGQVATTNYEEENIYAGVEYIWSGFEKQTWLIGLEYSSADYFDSYSDQNFDTANLIPGTPFPAPLPTRQRFTDILEEGRERRISSVYIQDYINISDRFAVTAGLRLDSYSDAGDALTPRVAGVYRLNGRHTLKAQYAEAFRPPTFVELYSTADAARGNRDITPETVRTTELSYIYKTRKTVFRSTLFHSDFDDLIVSENRQFKNSNGATVRGLDIEFAKTLSERIKLEADVSFADTEDDDTGQPLEGSADWVANAGLLFQPVPDWSVYLHYRYIDERHRSAADLREDLDGYSFANLTVSRFNLGYRGVTLRVDINNLFDDDITDPAPANSYVDDYPRAGRIYFAQLSVDF